jgi:hypothetical protein
MAYQVAAAVSNEGDHRAEDRCDQPCPIPFDAIFSTPVTKIVE